MIYFPSWGSNQSLEGWISSLRLKKSSETRMKRNDHDIALLHLCCECTLVLGGDLDTGFLPIVFLSGALKSRQIRAWRNLKILQVACDLGNQWTGKKTLKLGTGRKFTLEFLFLRNSNSHLVLRRWCRCLSVSLSAVAALGSTVCSGICHLNPDLHTLAKQRKTALVSVIYICAFAKVLGFFLSCSRSSRLVLYYKGVIKPNEMESQCPLQLDTHTPSLNKAREVTPALHKSSWLTPVLRTNCIRGTSFPSSDI